MKSSNLIRWGGAAAMLGGVLFVVSALLILAVDLSSYGEAVTTGTFTVHAVLFMLAAALLLLGLVGLYASHSEAAGAFGLVGFLFAFFGTAFALGLNWAETFAVPVLAQAAPELLAEGPSGRLAYGFALSFPLFSLGWLLFGIALLRARVYPRVAAVLFIIGALLTFVPVPGFGIVLGVAVTWLGYALFSGKATIAEQQPQRVR